MSVSTSRAVAPAVTAEVAPLSRIAPPPPLEEQQCWEAVCRRDASWDGRFLFGVVTTGVYCRPSCPARRPRRENARFFPTAAAAQAAGLRACKRCRPDETRGAAPAWVRQLCEHIQERSDSGEPLTLQELSRRVGLSPAHLQRRFRAAVGVTPRQYAELCRLESFRRELRAGDSVTGAIYAAGFGSSSRVYERVDSRLGMTPGEYRSGGRGVAITYATVDTAMGPLLLAATDRGLCFVQLGGTTVELVRRLRREYPAAELQPMASPPPPQFEAWMEALRRHLRGEQPHLDLPLDVRASAFQQRVWSFLQSIPWGETRSYTEVATGVGAPGAARAVARACASNPVAVVVPCHRVIRADGGLAGYRWGTARKKRLLAAERA
ncbi:MAG TPA: bifunctional DNA-binding transcriptional regulator/O6-methylguanine-DNA methyltransferase Ada [Thermoanaerobaculia bacterium]|jgi:AraC family transcriptional regulator of adaptative response/methylated-DNA-[protein]-cysteine methyltransferase|nr:bifunctional DNA-binding transcriptional regulator/O6-methylguanine-DNA methyltransferase Ada [Thermoanaerobaculia bacterium]